MADQVVHLPALQRPVEVRANTFDEGSNTIEVLWTAGAVVRRIDWFDGPYDEELVVDDDSVRLDRLNAGAPFLDSHDSFELRSVIGSVVPGSAKLRNGQGFARVQLTRRPEAQGTIQDIREGVIRNISCGYWTHAAERLERDGQPPLLRVIDWEPLEISAVAIPADAAAHIRSERRDAKIPCVIRDAPRAPASRSTTIIRARMQVRARSVEGLI